MTTIAYDGVSIAADTLTLFGVEKAKYPARKIEVRGDGIYAASGPANMLRRLIKWLHDGADYDDTPSVKMENANWSLLVIKPDGTAWCAMMLHPELIRVSAPFAIGSGADFALGAMACGKTAAEAVEIASQFDVNTGGSIVTVAIPHNLEALAAE